MIIILNILRMAIYGRVASNPNMLDTSLAGSDWLVLLLLYGPVLNERALLNGFIFSH